MNIKFRLITMNFLEFFVWGAWLISLGGYMFSSLHATGSQIGLTYGTMGLASLFMPALMGVIADRWVNAEKVLGFCHLMGAGLLFWASKVQNPETMYWVILLNSMFFMPTIALNNTVSYITLENKGFDIIKTFPPIRVWGTIGFIVAVWIVDIFGWTLNSNQFLVAATAAVLLAMYSFSMPPCLPGKKSQKLSWSESFGLDAFVLFKRKKMAIFFLFAMLLGAALQITNAFGKPFLDDFGAIAAYRDSFGVKHSNILISISQISETLFILAIPFFLKRFGIKIVMLISILAWVFRFGLFAIGDPGQGLWLLVLSMIIYGMAFDFFNISGSLFVEREAEPKIRASAQGLFMVMTNGVGAYLGGWLSGLVVDYFTVGEIRNWPDIWLTFAAYALVLAIIFPLVFKYKHQKDDILIKAGH
ncbi:nucleoside permease [Pedobacter sp. SD-b]|uniref:Nucleoside permease n=1 Tax=Pedobacter segetis TaxID=2793069 RepID=A0ABS1BFX8_9SPHI|nr:nucleoside permease [Pedobacter segetis]MBK0381696.1 nucleoside permease [Pedobacter segetis]